MQFAELIDQEVGVLIPKLDAVRIFKVKVIGVEGGGIWISSQSATNAVLQILKVPAAPKTLVFFLPYHEITFAMVGAEGPALDEKAFGV